MNVYKEDLLAIAHTYFCEDGNLVCVCRYDELGLQQIILREILKCFGNYSIVKIFDTDNARNKKWYQKTKITDTEYVTNLPYHLFESVANQ